VNRLRPADVLAGAGGVVLLGSLFLHWYGFAGAGGPIHPLTAWQAFSAIDILLALIAALAIGVPITSAVARSPAKPVAFALGTSVGGFLAVLLVLFRLIDQPGNHRLVTVQAGAWVGLAGALITLVGGWLALADDHTPGAVPPRLPRRPAPTGLEPRSPAAGA
jgi:hypothetical protein